VRLYLAIRECDVQRREAVLVHTVDGTPRLLQQLLCVPQSVAASAGVRLHSARLPSHCESAQQTATRRSIERSTRRRTRECV